MVDQLVTNLPCGGDTTLREMLEGSAGGEASNTGKDKTVRTAMMR
jgi:hypothetical protein